MNKQKSILAILVKLIKKISFTRIKKLFFYVRTEGMEATRKRFRECLVGTDIYREKLALKKIKNITSLEQCERIEFPEEKTPLVSVIIPVYNQFSFTYHCLKSIKEAGDKTSMEIIIADDCSTDFTKDIKNAVKNIKIKKTESNVGFLKNCNQAAACAVGKYIFFLNNDTQVQSGWLDTQVKLMESSEEIGMTGAKLVYPDGRLQEAGGIIYRDGSAANYGNRQDAFLPEYNYVKEVDYVSGAAIMIRRNLWESIGGFDAVFAPAYCEDTDLAFSVRKAGYKVMYQPESVVVHFEGVSNGTDVTKGIKAYQIENKNKLYAKWKETMEEQFLPGENDFRARERSGTKKIILMIDHTIPYYDCDAGARTEYQFIKLFIKKGFIVKYLPNDFRDTLPYVKDFERMGVEVLYGEYYKKNIFQWLEKNKKNIDIVFLNRPDISGIYIDYFKEHTSCKIIYYGMDFYYLRNLREYQLTGDQTKKKEAEQWLALELDAMKKADVSYFPSEAEVNEIKKINEHLHVKAISGFVYEEKEPTADFAKRQGLLFVGGFRHTPNQDGIVWFVNDIYPIIRKQMPIPLYIVGSNPTKKIKELENVSGVTIFGHVTEDELQNLYKKTRFVIAPLRYGAGVKGKVVEAMYYGVPVITTSIGIEGIPETEGIPVEDNARSFAQKLVELYTDEEQFLEIQKKETEIVRRHYSAQALWKCIKEDFICEKM